MTLSNIPEVETPDSVRRRQRGTYYWEGLYDHLIDCSRREKALQFTPELWEAAFTHKLSDHLMRLIVGDEDHKAIEPRQFYFNSWAEIKARLDSCAKRRDHWHGASPCRHAWEQGKRILLIWLDLGGVPC